MTTLPSPSEPSTKKLATISGKRSVIVCFESAMNFKDYNSSLPLDKLRKHQPLLNSIIVQKESVPKHSPLSTSVSEKRDINDFVTYQDRFLDTVDVGALEAECLSMGFTRGAGNNAVQNKFVSMFSKPYRWDSSGGPVINNPVPMEKFPNIKRTMDRLNTTFGYSLNCCLVSYYKNGQVKARLHSDDEDELDESQPIAVVSLGATRAIEFVDKAQESFRHNALSLHPTEGSLYVMHAGCQQGFQHRVRMNKRVKQFRISLSFRSFVQAPHSTKPTPPPLNLASSPVLSESSFATCDSQTGSPLSPVIVKPLAQLVDFGKFLPSKPVVFKLNPAPVPELLTSERRNLSPSPVTEHLTSDRRKPLPNNKPLNLSSIHSPVSPGYAPFPSQSHDEHTVSANTQSRSNNNEKVCVIFGTSITELVDGTVLSKKNRTVVNISSSGANINDIRSMANDFHHENLRSIHKIDKIIVSVGTNDIKWYNSFAKNMYREIKPDLVMLVKELKQLFPAALIHFHTVLPMRIVYKYTANSVHQFNNMLYEICGQYNCFFLDCFSRFLDKHGVFYNRSLFRDNWHLNNAGLKVFCRALKFIIYGNMFNPLPRYSLYSQSYPFK